MQTANSPQLECRGGMQTYQCADIAERSYATSADSPFTFNNRLSLGLNLNSEFIHASDMGRRVGFFSYMIDLGHYSELYNPLIFTQ